MTQKMSVENKDVPRENPRLLEKILDRNNAGKQPIEKRPRRTSNIATWAGLLVAAISTFLLFAFDFSRETEGALVLALLMGLLICGVYIGLAMSVAGTVGLLNFVGIRAVSNIWEETMFQVASSYTYSVIPMFVLMSMILGSSGLVSKAFESASAWFGRVPGGLAISTNFAGAGLAAASGSSIAISYSLGRVAIPEMLRAGYRSSLATSSVAMAGTLGQIIPPSILLVIYAGVVQTPVGPQLIAGIVPGLLLAIVYAGYIFVRSAVTKDFAPALPTSVPLVEKIKLTRHLVPIVLVVSIVIGGIFTGALTATEAGAVGALVAFIVGILIKRKSLKSVNDIVQFISQPFVEMVKTTSGILLLIIGVTVLTRALALSRIPNTLSNWLLSLELSTLGVIAALVGVYFVLGMFLDALAIMLLTVPILATPLETMGVDLIWFGVFVIIMAELGQVSPPIGMLAFIVHKVAQNPAVNLGQRISLGNVFAGLMPFIAVCLALIGLLAVFPDIVLWLPRLSG